MEMPRQCVVSFNGYDGWEQVQAYFHGFGTQTAYAERDNFAVTAAIVEFAEDSEFYGPIGTVLLVEPRFIQFLDTIPLSSEATVSLVP